MIKPTVGRVVWYKPDFSSVTKDFAMAEVGDYCAAIITKVHSDHCVNLAVFSASGMPHARQNVRLYSDRETPSDGGWCCWMPFQLGQAARTQQTEPTACGLVGNTSARTAPRVTQEDIEENIKAEHYFTAQQGVVGAAIAAGTGCADGTANPLNLLTFCVLVLKNDFTVVGESACVGHATFNADVGRSVARENAINKVWPLMGYMLKSKLLEN